MKSASTALFCLLFMLAQVCFAPSGALAGGRSCAVKAASESSCCHVKAHHCRCCVDESRQSTPVPALPAPSQAGSETILSAGPVTTSLWTLPPSRLPSVSTTDAVSLIPAPPLPLFLRQGALLI